MEKVVRLMHQGRIFTFYVDPDPPLIFWKVECEGRVWCSPIRVSGSEQPEFFRSLAETASKFYGL